ncbi:Mobile element protein [Alloalcanivorax xenomutans]|nr:Mobile element protein [Alloalcanivorax xenomutans]
MDAKQNRFQQKAIKRRLSRQDTIRFLSLLTSAELFDVSESLLPEHRERLFPSTETLAMFLSQVMQADRSCQRVVNEAAVARWLGGRKVCSTSTGGYCKVRQRLPLELVSSLARATRALINKKVLDSWHWQGLPVRIVDGTTVTLPDTPANSRGLSPATLAETRPGLPSVSHCRRHLSGQWYRIECGNGALRGQRRQRTHSV